MSGNGLDRSQAKNVRRTSSRQKAVKNEGFASPSNLPLRIAPPKPARVVVSNESLGRVNLKRKFAFSTLDSEKSALADRHSDEGSGDEAENDEFNFSLSRSYRKISPSRKVLHFDDLLEEIRLLIFSYLFQSSDLFNGPWRVCRSWNRLCRHPKLWANLPSFRKNGTVNDYAFRSLGMKNQGTEGQCYKVLHRRSGRVFAMKNARVYPTGEGVPYYMLRELAFLKGLRHPNIAAVERISLSSSKLYLFFDYVEKSLFDLINPNNDVHGGFPLPQTLVKRFLFQILQGVVCCHQRGILHRNLKPKHLLIKLPTLTTSQYRCVDVKQEKSHLGKMLGCVNNTETQGSEQAGTVLSHIQKGHNGYNRNSLVGCTSFQTQDQSASCAKRKNSAPKRKTYKESSSTNLIDALGTNTGETEQAGVAKLSNDRSGSEDGTMISFDVYSALLASAEKGILRISDFALVRNTSIPLRNYTAEVVTLWYRSPEVLMGGEYFAAVDVWSVGCVFAEMCLGKPIFPGICEVDQLFQIFWKLGTPSEKEWSEFRSLPNFAFEFPNWKPRSLSCHVPSLDDDGLDLMSRMFEVNPLKRITASDALKHRYFDDIREVNTVDFIRQEEALDAAKVEQLETLEAALPSAKASEEFDSGTFSPGEVDLDRLVWCAPDAISDVSFWKYSTKLEKTLFERTRTRKGMEDPSYLIQYFHYLKLLESELYPLSSCMHNDLGVDGYFSESADRDIGNSLSSEQLLPIHRSMLVDWLVEVIDVFEMSVRGVFMAVHYTDRYLSLEVVQRKNFQLLGATCLHIASKCEDVSYIGVEDLVICADNVYGSDDVLKLEEKVLNALNFRIYIPTVVDFVHAFLVRLDYSPEEDALCTVGSSENLGDSKNRELSRMVVTPVTKALVCYLAELSLQEIFFMTQMPSLVAAAALVLALYFLDTPIEKSKILGITGYDIEAQRPCIERLQSVHSEAAYRTSLQVIYRRYQRANMQKVANLDAKPNLSGLFK